MLSRDWLPTMASVCRSWGWSIRQSLSGDAAVAYEDFVAEGGVVMPWAGELDGEAELLVDAILGSGLERDVGGKFADAVSAINAHAAKVLALDIPTGIHGDSGKRPWRCRCSGPDGDVCRSQDRLVSRQRPRISVAS